jgi:type VI protein secretion system component VasF
MAPTKRKRRTKHRGNAAGTIESRGRTGRPASPEEKKKQARTAARDRRMNTPPTWKAAINKAMLAAVVLFVFVLITQRKNHNAVLSGLIFAAIALVLYIPAGYYIDLMVYRRRQAKNRAAGGGKDTKR